MEGVPLLAAGKMKTYIRLGRGDRACVGGPVKRYIVPFLGTDLGDRVCVSGPEKMCTVPFIGVPFLGTGLVVECCLCFRWVIYCIQP